MLNDSECIGSSRFRMYTHGNTVIHQCGRIIIARLDNDKCHVDLT